MAESTRIRGFDVAVLTLGGVDILALFQEAVLTVRNPRHDVTAVKDADGKHERPSHGSPYHEFTLRARKLIDAKASLATLAILGLGSPATKYVAWTFKENATGNTYAGNGWADDYTLTGPDGAQTEELTIAGDGAMTIT